MKFTAQVCTAVLLAVGANARALGWEEGSFVTVEGVTPSPTAKATSQTTGKPRGYLPADSLAESAQALADYYSKLAVKASASAVSQSIQLSSMYASYNGSRKAKAAKTSAVASAAAVTAITQAPKMGKDGIATVTVLVTPTAGSKSGKALENLDIFGFKTPGLLGIYGEGGLIGDITDYFSDKDEKEGAPKPAKTGGVPSPVAGEKPKFTFKPFNFAAFGKPAKPSNGTAAAKPSATKTATLFEEDEE